MNRAARRLLTVAAAAVIAVPLTGAAAYAGLRPSVAADTVHGQSDLPADAPAALYRPEPALPAAKGWPGSNTAFSQTSGAGRYADGGYYWTDYLYDDHGTTTGSAGDVSVTAGSPSFGTYTYPPGESHNNGADIFRAAVYRGADASYWRVDWNTLTDPTIPIAEWTFDRDDKTSTGGSTWPGNAGVHSPGIGRALIMSSRGAELVAVPGDKVLAHLHTTVTMGAHSFVVRVPNHVLHVGGSWRIRLAAGLADATGTGFAPAADALPIQTRVYNVTFRTRTQENPADNFWNDKAQTFALAAGDVAKFSTLLRWSLLAHRITTAQPRPTGWSDRWYVSDVSLGPGLVDSAATIADGKPNYLGRVQPYAVYVPASYRPGTPTPLTFLLHSLTQNQNQYAATTPKFSKLACEDRHSICVTTLGRGPDGNYFDTAELDFWQVWHSVATTYNLNPNRTTLCGYSMGGIGTNQLSMAHPDLFASAVTLAGAVGDVPSLVNLRWVPLYQAGGAEDELVPLTVEHAEAAAMQALGDRFRWVLYPAIDHVAYELADSFTDAAHYMGSAPRVRNPGSFTYTWQPTNGQDTFGTRELTGGGLSWSQEPAYGVGTTGDYWLRDLRARDRSGSPKVVADSGERPELAVTPHAATGIDVTDGPEPGVATQQTWTRGSASGRSAVIRLTLTDVRSLRILLAGAGFAPGQHGRVVVSTDGGVTVHLAGQARHLPKGRHVVRFTAQG